MRIDSLQQAWKNASHDTVRIRTDVYLGRAFETLNFDSALFYYHRALSRAQESSMQPYPFFEGLVLENIGFAFIYGKGQTLQGIAYLKKALSSHVEAGLLSEANKTEYNIGFFYGSNYDSALYHYNQVIERHRNTERMDRLHESYNNAGLTYFYKGQYALSAQYFTKAVRLKEETGETGEIQHAYGNLGIVFLNLSRYERAKEYFRKANKIMLKTEEKDGVVINLRNIADVLVEQDSIDAALEYYEKARTLSEETGNQIGVSFYFNALGQIFEKEGDYDQALRNYQLAYDNFTSRVNDRYSSSVMTSLGRTKLLLLEEGGELSAHRKRETIQEALELGEESWKRAVRSGLIDRKLTAAQLLQSVYSQKGDYKKALAYADTAFLLTNTLNSKAQSQAIAFAATEYETERVENENALLQQTQQTQAARLKQQSYLIFGVAIGLMLIAIIAALIYRSRLSLKKANEITEKSLLEKELLLKEIHHRVKNNLQVVSSLLDLQSRGIEDEEALATFMEGQNRVKAMALIHQKLYQNEDLATIDFAEYAENLMKELAALYPSSKAVETQVVAGENAQFDIDTAVPLGLILNELISNAYKYAFDGKSGGQLSVSVEPLGQGKHQLVVADSGAGLPETFDLARAKSLGLRLVRRLAKQLYGSVTYSYEAGAKFVVIFTDTLERKAV